MYQNCLKRLLAIVLSLLGILCLGWLLLLLSIAIKLDSPGPVLFKQKRVGRGKSHFYILKFRTMRTDTPKDMPTHLLANPEQYITRVGKFLRKTSLDELPQLFNILFGHMAVIGPRPIVEKEVAYYGPHYDVFSRVKPGITGFWQVSGRSGTTYERRIELDMYYINNWSIWLDYYIFLKTIKEVLICRGAE